MGRYRYSRRPVVESCFRVGIKDLAGVLKKPAPVSALASGNIVRNINGEYDETLAAYALQVETGEDGGTLNFRHTFRDREYTSVHRLVRQPVNLGGFRWFIRCGNCGSLRKHLYFHYTAFACRDCCRMVYRGSREHRHYMEYWNRAEKAEKQADSLRAGNHPKLARKLEDRAAAYWEAHEEREDGALFRFLRRFAPRAGIKIH